MGAGAAVLTDSIYWTVIFPFLSLQDYEMSFVSFYAISSRIFIVKACARLTALSMLHKFCTQSANLCFQMTVNLHTSNLVLLLIDTSLNRLVKLFFFCI